MEATLSSGAEDIVVFSHTLGSLPAIKAFLVAVDRKQIKSAFHHATRIVAIIA